LFSHKIIRFLVPFFFLGSFMSAIFLAPSSLIYAVYAVSQVLLIFLGLAGIFQGFGGRPGRLSAFFLLTIYAQLLGWIRWATGKSYIMWKPER
jgi:hypothetical protein